MKYVFGVFAVVGWVLLVGLHTVWAATFGWLFRTMADLLDRVELLGHHLFGPLTAWLRSLDRNMSTALAHAANELEHSAVWLFSRLGVLAHRLGGEIGGLADSVFAALWRILHVRVPRLLHKLLGAVWSQLRRIPSLFKRLDNLAGWVAKKIKRGVAEALAFAAHVAQKGLKYARKGLAAFWKAHLWALKRLRRLERQLVPRRVRSLVLGALGGLGLTWLVSINVIRFGKWLVHLDPGGVYEWVNDALNFGVRTDVCAMQGLSYDAAVHVFEPFVRREYAETYWTCETGTKPLPSAATRATSYLGSWQPSGTNAPEYIPRVAPGIPLPRGVIRA